MSVTTALLRLVRPLFERHFALGINIYPPYLGAGIRVTEVAPDFRSIRVRMRLGFYNRNYVGTHFGGSLYSMCDPFYMLMVLKNLGDDYIVWDKEARIRFVRPGRGTVQAHFTLRGDALEALRAAADRDGKAERVFSVDVTDEAGEVVARVDKRVYVRRKGASA